MSVIKVKGLLDRPSRRSLGMLGVLVEHESKGVSVSGVVGVPAGKLLDDSHLRRLLESGDARLCDGPLVEDDGRPHAALWVGAEFEGDATRLGVPLPPLPKRAEVARPDGRCWIGPTRHVWHVLDSWLARAFRRSIQEDNQELAALMAWAIPDRPETRAAIWHTDRGARHANLEWWARLDRDHGDAGGRPRDLEARYEAMVSEARSRHPVHVFGFCAPAKGGDNEIAEELSRQLHVPRVGFGKWLKQKAESGGSPTARSALQRDGLRVIDTRGALQFCLEVLGGLPGEVRIPNDRFVIDGIRHDDVFHSLRTLVGEDHFTLVYVDRPAKERRQLLMDEEGIAEDKVDAVMNDPTEAEVGVVAQRTQRRYQMAQGKQAIVRELASLG